MLNDAPRDARRAFTLLEVVVSLAVLALLAAVIVAAVGGRVAQGRTAALAQTLSSLSAGVLEYRADVRRYPLNLRHLTTAPTYGVTDLCNRTVPASYLTSWRGPYLKQVIPVTGLVLEEMTVADAMELNPVGPYTVTSNGTVVIVVSDVDATTADDLEKQFDGNNNLAAGTIRFTATASGKGTLRFAIPVRGC